MAFNYSDNRVTATSGIKTVKIKSVKLTFSDVVLLGAAASVKAVLPAQASIVDFRFWKKTQLSGGSVSAATLSIGIPGSATFFVNAADILTPTAGVTSSLTSVTTHQTYNVPAGGDISLLFTGTATTGNPTAGEFYVDIFYVE
jgi:hypothetical protein